MLIKKNKKISIYIFLFIFLGTLNNKNIYDLNFFKINNIKVTGLGKIENKKLEQNLEILKSYNLYFIDDFLIRDLLNSNSLIEKYHIKKKYPSSLEVKVNKTDLLAYIIKDNKVSFFGSNGKLIPTSNHKVSIPYIYGNFEKDKFFELKNIIDKSKFNYSEIKNFFYFPSGRWDIEMKSNILIKLPKEDIEKVFFLSYEILQEKKFQNIKILDLRQTDQVIID